MLKLDLKTSALAQAGYVTESAISPIEEIIEAPVNGSPFILVDAEDRENEGDVIIPAQFATLGQINFMTKRSAPTQQTAMTLSRRATCSPLSHHRWSRGRLNDR